MIENVIEKKDSKYEKIYSKITDFSAESIFFYPIIAIIFHKLFFSTFLYLTFSFQHIKHNLNDLDTIYSNVKKT